MSPSPATAISEPVDGPPVRYGIAAWLAAPIAALLLAMAVYDLTPGKLCQPIVYGSDSFSVLMWAQTLLEKGWWMSADRIGLPGRMEMYDYPADPTLHFALMKVLALGIRDPVELVNVYFLLGFPLIALTTLITGRALRVPPLAASVCALLFALQSYHFRRGTWHLFLSSYFLLPLLVLVAIWVARGEILTRRRGWAAVLICAALGFDFPYYPVFGCFFLAVAGLFAAARRGSLRPLMTATLLIAVTAGGLLASHAPNLVYRIKHGPNLSPSLSSKRSWAQSEIFGLKLTALVMPYSQHPLAPLRKLGAEYFSETPVRSEGESAALGLVGAVGLVGLLGVLLFGRAPGLARILATLTGAALLLAMVGGFGTLFSLLVSPIMRCYVRISIFIAFFALLGVALAVARLRDRRPWLYRVAALALLAIGVPDQVIGQGMPELRRISAADYQRDQRYFAQVEALLPPRAAIFQLPQHSFLANEGPCYPFFEYDQFRGYLHTRTLRWSFGAVCGREPALLQEAIAKLPTPALVEQLALIGFDGVTVDRNPYRDRAPQMLAELRAVLGPEAVQSEDGRLQFFTLAIPKHLLAIHHSPAELDQMRDAARHPILQLWTGDFSGAEGEPPANWHHWCGGQGELMLSNLRDRPRTVRLRFRSCTFNPTPATLFIEAPAIGLRAAQPLGRSWAEPRSHELTVVLPPGRTVLRFHSDAVPGYEKYAGGGGRKLVFAVRNFEVKELP